MTFKHFTAAAITLAAAVSASAADAVFTYDYSGKAPEAYGYNKKTETVSVAIFIPGSGMAGKQVTGLSVPLALPTDTTPSGFKGDFTGWLSTELKAEKKLNVPDICSAIGSVTNGVLSVTFAEPYTITADGVYVGYTLDIDKVTDYTAYPIAVAPGSNPDGLYLLGSRSQLSWASKSEAYGYVSAMKVNVSGDIPARSVVINVPNQVTCKAGALTNFPGSISTFGTEPVYSYKYESTVGDKTGTTTVTSEKPMPAYLGYTESTSISVNVPETYGDYPASITVLEINEQPVANATPVTFTVTASPFVPVSKPFVEEYTGFWCGYCPVGFVALERLKARYNANAVSYHDSDELAIIPPAEFPSNVTGFPDGYINRTSVYPGDLVRYYPEFVDPAPSTLVDVKLSWANAEETILKATVTASFANAEEKAAYRLGCVLVEDGLSNPEWEQHNYLSGETGSEFAGEEFKPFIEGGDVVKGLVFDDVVLSFPHPFGKPGSVPTSIKQFDTVTYEETFDLNTICTIAYTGMPSRSPIEDINKLRVVGVLFNSNGIPLNSGSSRYATGGGQLGAIRSVETSRTDGPTTIYDLQGRRVSNPTHGLYIINGIKTRL